MPQQGNGTLRFTIAVFGPLAVLVGAAVGYGILKTEVNYNAETIVEASSRLDANIAADHRRDLELGDLKKDLAYLKETAAEQKIDIKNHTVLLENILDRVTK